jgi:alpha-amylase
MNGNMDDFSTLKSMNDAKIHINHINDQTLENLGDGVMLQAFYWSTPDIGKWWTMLENQLPEFAETGFDALWLPPMSKTDSGDVSTNGYEPYDYYDLGEFDQKGSVRTRYGTRAELESLIAEADNLGVAMIADIVINHNVGGESEYNPYALKDTYTNFMNIASEKFPRNYTHFYPCEYGTEDNYAFANFPDLCHKNPYVSTELIKWGKWLHDEIGYDGWRFDVALGIDAEMLRDWMQNVTGWGIAEYWGGSYSDLVDYLDDANGTLKAFDFYLMYQLRWMAVSNGNYNMHNLRNAGLLGDRSDQAVTFVSNHDTVRDTHVNIDQNKHMAYAYILTHEGYPSVFWNDYFDLDLQPHIKALIVIHNNYARGPTEILYTSSDVYVAQRSGDPGLIIGLNDNPSQWKEVAVTTKWSNTVLHDLTGQAPDAVVDTNGETTIQIPPKGYAVYSNSEKITTVPSILEPENHQIPEIVSNGTITVDGKLDENWNIPTMIDNLGDASGNGRDLTKLYVMNDNTNLYIGLGYGQKPWIGGDIHYGIAFDVKSGGSHNDSWVHENIRWTGNKLPDYIYYLETDSEDPWAEINKARRFSYDSVSDKWDSGTNLINTDYFSNNILGFLELKIPLDDIDLSQGGNLSIMVFSTIESKLGAVDSIPNDRFTDAIGDIVSWLTMPDPFKLIVDVTTTTSTSSTEVVSLSIIVVVLATVIAGLSRIKISRKDKDRK